MSVYDRVKKIFLKLGIKESEVLPDASLTGTLGFDSTELVELVVSIEKEFGIKVPDNCIGRLNTIQDITIFVQENLK